MLHCKSCSLSTKSDCSSCSCNLIVTSCHLDCAAHVFGLVFVIVLDTSRLCWTCLYSTHTMPHGRICVLLSHCAELCSINFLCYPYSYPYPCPCPYPYPCSPGPHTGQDGSAEHSVLDSQQGALQLTSGCLAPLLSHFAEMFIISVLQPRDTRWS